MSFYVARIELTKIFKQPITWGILSLSIILLSLLFYRLCLDYLQAAAHALNQQGVVQSISLSVFKPFCSWSIMLLAIIMPLFTTQSLSQEFRLKTIYLWAKSPHSPLVILVGKMLSIIFIMLIILAAMLMMMISFSLEMQLTWSIIVGILFITAAVGASFICFDLFICSFISNPILALVTCLLGNLTWMLLEWLNPFPLTFCFLAKKFSLLSHSYHFLNGILYSPDIIFYLVFCGFWLSITVGIFKFKMRQLA